MSDNEKSLYPPNYKQKHNCLYVVRKGQHGEYAEKLCNFSPRIVAEVTVDDGATATKRLVLGGVHESGRILNEVEISASDLATFQWVIEHWGADCILGVSSKVKENLRFAIQHTAYFAQHPTIYNVTGWKRINDKWRFLLPGCTDVTVELSGKLKHYEGAYEYSAHDVVTAKAFLDLPLAPKEVIFPLLAFTFLSPLNEFLHRANCEPKFVLFLLGKTGTRKSTLAALFLSFFGRFTASELPLSFRDTANSILHHAFTLKDVLTCIDDFHPSRRQEEVKLVSTAQAVMRSYGDRTGRGRLKADATPMESRPPQGNAVVTAEFAPDIGESGTARYFGLELKNGDVDLQTLSWFQNEAENGVFKRAMCAYIEMLTTLVNQNEALFVKSLADAFKLYRQEFMDSGVRCHGRVPEIVAWLRIGMKLFLLFMQKQNMMTADEAGVYETEFADILFRLAQAQAENIEHDKPTHIFIRKLFSLIESGSVTVLSRNGEHILTPLNVIGYEDEQYLYLNKTATHCAVKKLCDQQGENFTITERGLLKALAEEGLIETAEGQNTKSVRIGSVTKRVVCLNKAKAIAIAEDGS